MRPAAAPLLALLSLLLLALTACTASSRRQMPELTAIQAPQGANGCGSVFPRGRWQFVHAIEFAMQEGSGSTVIGITTLAPGSISCALTTVEGFTLFEAIYHDGKGLEVQRAVPPFDKPAFAEGLIEDVQAIFLAPLSTTMRYGAIAGKMAGCRYSATDGRITDIIPAHDDCWQIQTYTAGMDLNRSIVGRSCRKEGDILIPEQIELRGFGQTGYTLKMTLIQAENLNEKALP